MKKSILLLVLFLPACGFGFNIQPDSIVVDSFSFLKMHSAIDTIYLKNETNSTMTIDSIKIRFIDGNPTDFRKGIDCQPEEFLEYNYQGWLYGDTRISLRYLRDSLFMLQDSSGNLIKISLNPNDSTFFYIQEIINCLFCGRMPSFPATSKYIYSFFLSDNTISNLKVTVKRPGQTSILSPADKHGRSDPLNSSAVITTVIPNNMEVFDILGRKAGTLAQGKFKDGTNQFNLDSRRFAKGVYYCTFVSGSNKAMYKILLNK